MLSLRNIILTGTYLATLSGYELADKFLRNLLYLDLYHIQGNFLCIVLLSLFSQYSDYRSNPLPDRVIIMIIKIRTC